ncbi:MULTISPECIES: NRDE family protein [Niastella]|uniref:NRDE family protein n=1 Tax=Niastella soli TaxID=2821487 RepID=A0ABS3YUL6_9BACT|nr:NRDE family protein [Niastella soli]MBO9201629.1 NRDE family protein [Niastella soli]
MCTVTFIRAADNIYITSNRDEKHWRSSAFPPAVYQYPSGKLLFPKDGDAGGTWIAAHENGNAIVFLNGGFERHQPKPPYRKSRGLILLDLLDSINPVFGFRLISLQQIEPFTAVIWSAGQLVECRWDGEKKHLTELSDSEPQIWSSVTLYEEAVVEKRKSWFREWLQKKKEPAPEDILHFHQFTGDGDAHNDLLMDRNGQVFTVSVTQLVLSDEETHMHYLDLRNDKNFTQHLIVEKSMAGRA